MADKGDRQVSESKSFSLGTVLSITTGKLLSENGIKDVYDILNFMTGDNLFTHQLPRTAEECAPLILERYPRLADIVVPEELSGAEACKAFVFAASQTHGANIQMFPIDNWERRHPLQELQEMIDPSRIVVVAV